MTDEFLLRGAHLPDGRAPNEHDPLNIDLVRRHHVLAEASKDIPRLTHVESHSVEQARAIGVKGRMCADHG